MASLCLRKVNLRCSTFTRTSDFWPSLSSEDDSIAGVGCFKPLPKFPLCRLTVASVGLACFESLNSPISLLTPMTSLFQCDVWSPTCSVTEPACLKSIVPRGELVAIVDTPRSSFVMTNCLLWASEAVVHNTFRRSGWLGFPGARL